MHSLSLITGYNRTSSMFRLWISKAAVSSCKFVRMYCPVTPTFHCLLALQFAIVPFTCCVHRWNVCFCICFTYVFIMCPHIVRHERNTSECYVMWQMVEFVDIGQKGSRNPNFLKWSHSMCLFSLHKNTCYSLRTCQVKDGWTIFFAP